MDDLNKIHTDINGRNHVLYGMMGGAAHDRRHDAELRERLMVDLC